MNFDIIESRNYTFKSSCEPYDVTLFPGGYFIELWGAQGGQANNYEPSGFGGYVAGYLYLKRKTFFYLYIGGKGMDQSKSSTKPSPSCNGGGAGGKAINTGYPNGASGGGATDLRLNKKPSSRVMVAGGGGGHAYDYAGVNAGGIIGSNGIGYKDVVSIGGTQNSGGSEGIGESGRDATVGREYGAEGNGGCGGGYYGGTASTKINEYSNCAGSGGSSYISGYNGCDTRSDIVFNDPIMIAGNSQMISTLFKAFKVDVSKTGDGFARITKFMSADLCTINSFNYPHLISIDIFLFSILKN